ncbi:D-alanyl-D-alanine carboxypeptidase [Sphingomonas sediminicola]|jgi:D-alanyl-D-alanine carboxypeptidase (penicillin-binding protein 5/6)|uniref:serine-type D-Ala-D-Ala carboxypeptidase n=1 Tax=Sphingomonas sediminicola TaxID=386874 RepID=A0ABX6TCG2_9SPHN|nr:D-alanyl-D-alanine carboxypeptidase family protein [Sphingomonas sediminicola]QNP46677.1 D-alanyl-D-alanine carboxypeptidase [Sphingomonas sediminicola]
MKRAILFASAAALTLSTAAPAKAPPFDTPARVAYLIDLSSGAVLLSKNADVRMPPASMAKMMTTNVAFELIKKGDLKTDKMCTVRPETWQKWHGPQAGSTMFLSPNEQVSVDELLKGIITLSGNDASVVLAECIAGTEEAFTNIMNENAKRLGLTNSHFGNSNGWPDEGRTYVTARDLATLARAEIENYPDLYKKYYSLTEYTHGQTLGSGAAITQANRNPLLGKVPGADGLKTGHTEEAGYGFTGSAEQNGRRLIMVVAGLDSYNGRIQESVRLMQWGFNAWQSKPLFKSGTNIGSAKVQMGSSSEVPLIAPRDLALTIPAGILSKTGAMKIRYQGPVKAPIAKGQHIADLVVVMPDGEQVMPLVAGEDVGQAGFFGRIWIGLKQLFGMA